MGKTFMPAQKTEKELAALQLEGLKWTVHHAFSGSPFYRKKFEEAGVRPDDIKKLADIGRLPFTVADDLRRGYPFPSFPCPLKTW